MTGDEVDRLQTPIRIRAIFFHLKYLYFGISWAIVFFLNTVNILRIKPEVQIYFHGYGYYLL